ncbi:hypothetical protein GW17_00022845 [Ensete ventricosum]|nr:hypothetical protein GW17_00022845 [Ensete ventricosum]
MLSQSRSPFLASSGGDFILTKWRVDRTLRLTFVDTPGEAVVYGASVGAEVWCEELTCRAHVVLPSFCYVSQLMQFPYFQGGVMSVSIDALEVGLRFPLHPVIGECLGWWRISPTQVAPNSWHYLITFLGECRGSSIISTRDLFLSCFRLCKGQGGYNLICQEGFKVEGAPSDNKGWKTHFLFVSRCRDWGFGVECSAHPISNIPRNLSDEESILVGQLKGILSASRAIRNLTEEWLVKAGLSPTSHVTH